MGDAGYERQIRARAEYRRRRPEWTDSVTRFRAIVDAHASRGSRVLDLGCGRNRLHGDDLGCANGSRVIGVDPDAAALRENRAISERIAATGGALPFVDGCFDIVASAWVLEHLDNPGRVFREVRRVLRPGGRFVFLTPNSWNYNAWLIRGVPDRWHGPVTRRLYGRGEGDAYPVRYRANSDRRVRRLLDAAGFARIDIVHNGDPSYVAFNRALLEAAFAVERLLALAALARARVHLLGVATTGVPPRSPDFGGRVAGR